MTEEQIQSFDVPPSAEEVGFYTTEEAKQRIAKLDADARINGHPLNPRSINHPQSKQYSEYKQNLFDVACPPDLDDEGNVMTPSQKIMYDGMKEQEQHRQADRNEAQELRDWLVERGWNSKPVPEDIQRHTLEGLRNQKKLEQGEYEQVFVKLLNDTHRLRANNKVVSKLHGFREAESDSEKFDILNDIIFWVEAEEDKKAKSLKKPKPQELEIL